MADEPMALFPGLQIDYTVKNYTEFQKHLVKRAEELNQGNLLDVYLYLLYFVLLLTNPVRRQKLGTRIHFVKSMVKLK